MPSRKSKKDSGERLLPKVYGYTQNSIKGKTEAKIEPNQKIAIVFIFTKLCSDRLPLNQIANLLNSKKSPNTRFQSKFTADYVKKIVMRPEYCGYSFNSSRELIRSKIYPPIVDKELWERAQEILTFKFEKHIHGSANQDKYPLSGFLSCFYCRNSYYIKCKNRSISYYWHKEVCIEDKTQKLIREKCISDLVYTVFVKEFTSLRYLKRKIQLYTYYSSIADKHKDSGNIKGFEFIDIDYAKNKLLHLQAELRARNWINNKNTINDIGNDMDMLIEKFSRSNEQYRIAFSNYLGNILDKWFSDTKSSKHHLLIDYFKSIEIKDQTMIISLPEEEKLSIVFEPLSDNWKNEIDAYKTNKNPHTYSPGIRNVLIKELKDYLAKKTKDLNHNQETILNAMANDFTEEIIANSKQMMNASLKLHYPISDYLNVNNSGSGFTKALICKLTDSKRHFIQTEKERTAISPFEKNESIIAFGIKDKTFFNIRYLHSLPEWFYGYNFEFFRTDKGKICFVEKDSTIQAMKLGKLGKKTPMDFVEALNTIMESTKFQFVDID